MSVQMLILYNKHFASNGQSEIESRIASGLVRQRVSEVTELTHDFDFTSLRNKQTHVFLPRLGWVRRKSGTLQPQSPLKITKTIWKEGRLGKRVTTMFIM
jgi:hypothetical protein